MTIDYNILEIEMAWGKGPGWFLTLSREHKADLLAFQRVRRGKQ